jgi:predicted SnoaL-like aldol condensation-catalyzing enzyme
MKACLSFFAVVSLLAAASAFAQEPVVGVPDPESLFTDPDPTLNANKQVALHVMRELLQCNQWDKAGQWISDRYLQHNPNVTSGLAPVVAYFNGMVERGVRKRAEPCGKLTTPVVAVLADDDIVAVMIAREMDDPRNPGKKYTTTWFDAWRIVNGKADEHWDPATIAPPAQ